MSGDITDQFYQVDEKKRQLVRDENKLNYKNKPEFVQKVYISAIAAMKMLIHAQEGVENGIKSSSTHQPIEVMGLLIGQPNINNPRELIVSDAFPLPITGAETRVVADDNEVTNYMINLSNQVTAVRKQFIMGWYHSHPFDLDKDSHCFLSGTDVATQLRWQLTEDHNGNPFVALVIDPQRSNFLKIPVIEAFRVYRPEYTGRHDELVAPDMKKHDTKESIVQRWGENYNRYYTFPIQIYSSNLNRQLLKSMTEKFLWMRVLCFTPLVDDQSQDRLIERIMGVETNLKPFDENSAVNDYKIRNSLPIAQNNSRGLSEDLLKLKTTEKLKEYIFNERIEGVDISKKFINLDYIK